MKQTENLSVLRLYLREVSLKVPPGLARNRADLDDTHSQMTVGIRVVSHDNSYEVHLNTMITCQPEEDKAVPIYDMVVEFGAVVKLDNALDEAEKKEILLVDVAQMMFPFNRTRIVQLIAEAGFPSPPFVPVDFRNLYEQNKGNLRLDEKLVLN